LEAKPFEVYKNLEGFAVLFKPLRFTKTSKVSKFHFSRIKPSRSKKDLKGWQQKPLRFTKTSKVSKFHFSRIKPSRSEKDLKG